MHFGFWIIKSTMAFNLCTKQSAGEKSQEGKLTRQYDTIHQLATTQLI